MANKLNLERNKKVFQIDYKENLAVALKMMEEIAMDLEDDSEILKEMQEVDLMEQDLLHMVEFHNFNASEGYNFAKMLQEIRQERRKIKNRLEERTKARDFLKNNYKPKFKAPLAQVVTNMQELGGKQTSRKYKLRALHQLEGFNQLISKNN